MRFSCLAFPRGQRAFATTAVLAPKPDDFSSVAVCEIPCNDATVSKRTWFNKRQFRQFTPSSRALHTFLGFVLAWPSAAAQGRFQPQFLDHPRAPVRRPKWASASDASLDGPIAPLRFAGAQLALSTPWGGPAAHGEARAERASAWARVSCRLGQISQSGGDAGRLGNLPHDWNLGSGEPSYGRGRC